MAPFCQLHCPMPPGPTWKDPEATGLLSPGQAVSRTVPMDPHHLGTFKWAAGATGPYLIPRTQNRLSLSQECPQFR